MRNHRLSLVRSPVLNHLLNLQVSQLRYLPHNPLCSQQANHRFSHHQDPLRNLAANLLRNRPVNHQINLHVNLHHSHLHNHQSSLRGSLRPNPRDDPLGSLLDSQ